MHWTEWALLFWAVLVGWLILFLIREHKKEDEEKEND